MADVEETAAATEAAVKRPRTVVLGAVLTYVGAGLAGLFGVLVLVGSADQSFLRSVESSVDVPGLPTEMVHVFVRDIGILITCFNAAVLVSALFAQRGRARARLVLSVLAGLYVLTAVAMGVYGSPAALATAAYVVAATALFWIRGANGWYRAELERRRAQ